MRAIVSANRAIVVMLVDKPVFDALLAVLVLAGTSDLPNLQRVTGALQHNQTNAIIGINAHCTHGLEAAQRFHAHGANVIAGFATCYGCPLVQHAFSAQRVPEHFKILTASADTHS